MTQQKVSKLCTWTLCSQRRKIWKHIIFRSLVLQMILHIFWMHEPPMNQRTSRNVWGKSPNEHFSLLDPPQKCRHHLFWNMYSTLSCWGPKDILNLIGNNKKVLLRDRKNHTACGIPCPYGDTPMSCLWLQTWLGVPLATGLTGPWTKDRGYPPGKD